MLALDTPHLSRSSLLERIQFARGNESAQRLARVSHKFERGARIAVQPWNALRAGDDAQLGVTFDRRQPHDTIAIVRIPDPIVEALRSAQLASKRGARAARGCVSEQEAVDALLDRLPSATHYRVDELQAREAGFSHGPGQTVSTTHGSEGLYVGLHLDSWDRLPPLERWRGSNRICVNLGLGDRFLQIVPYQAADIVSILRAQGLDVLTKLKALRDSTGRLDLARRFLEIVPQAPVIRIRMLPGEAYIAPTENVIHDACVDGTHDDLTLTIRGRVVAV